MMEFGVVNTLGLTLLHFLWQGLLIGLVYALGKYLLNQARAESRYAWALGTLFLLLMAPVISFLVLHVSPPVETGQPGGPGVYASMTTGGIHAATHNTGPTLASLLPWVAAFWISGVLLLSLRLSLGWRYIHWLRKTANFQIPGSHQALLEQLCRQLGIRQSVRLAQSAMVHGPVLIGVLRPLILIPATLATGLTPRQLEMVLAHELAHLKRFDHLINLFQTLVETLLFYHPVVRWVSRDLRIERELVSDEMASQLTGDRVAYAETLLMLERERGDRIELAMAMADQQVAARVRRLLTPAKRQSGSIGASMAALVLVMTTVAVGLYDTQQDPGQNPMRDDDNAISTPPIATPSAEPASTTHPALNDEVPATASEEATIDRLAQELELTAQAPELAPAVDASRPDTRAIAASTTDDLPEIAAADEAGEIGDGGEETGRPASANTAGEDDENDAPSFEAARNETTVRDAAAIPPPETAEPGADLALAQLDDMALPDTRPESLDSVAESVPRSLPQSAPQSPPQSTPPSQITGGELLRQVPPAYPRTARRQGHEGSVEVRFSVDEQGRVRNAEVVSESPKGYDFGKEAIRAVEQWRFEPFRRDGEAVSYEIHTGFDFQEPDECTRLTGTRINRC